MTIAAPLEPRTDTKRSRPRRPSSAAKRARPNAKPAARKIADLQTTSGAPRELVARSGAGGSLLIIDRDAIAGSDERLVAHLAADEPAGNATLIGRLYADAQPGARRCRRLEESDALTVPPCTLDSARVAPFGADVMQGAGAELFRVECCPSRMSIPELRWTACPADGSNRRIVSLRDSIAAAEDYQPLLAMTMDAVGKHVLDETVSTTTLRAELARVQESPIVLNRGLREAVQARVAGNQSSLSEIAIRCGRVKRDSRGNQSGETSWLARRIGILPEGGQSAPTVWVHSDVLGLIAREGLGISPMEVELG